MNHYDVSGFRRVAKVGYDEVFLVVEGVQHGVAVHYVQSYEKREHEHYKYSSRAYHLRYVVNRAENCGFFFGFGVFFCHVALLYSFGSSAESFAASFSESSAVSICMRSCPRGM